MHHTGGSGYRRRGHAMHKQGDEKALQREIDDLKKQLHRAQRKQSPHSSDVSSNDKKNTSYRQRSGTPPRVLFLRGGAFSQKKAQESIREGSRN